jgi:hypothetical protein
MLSRFVLTRTMMCFVGALGVFASGFATSNQVVSAAPADGFGTAIGNLVSGPTAQSASNSWQYFEIPDNLASATLLPNWQTTGNECVLNQNQWDNNRVNGNYPFVQFVQTRPASNLHGGNTFGANAELLIHPDSSSYRAAIGWKNTTGATVLIDYAATLKLAFPQNNNDGIAYSFQRGLSGTARYLSLKSGIILNGSTATTQLNGSLVELQSGELVYLTVGNKGNYYWDHTIATMSISLTSPPTSSVVGADTVVTFSSVGSRTWTAPANVTSLQYLIVGGGGGGSGGGGGAGGVLYNSSYSVTPGNSYAVVVGDGGSGSDASVSGGDGSNSSFNSIVANGGGGGGARQGGGRAGASSGGAGQDSSTAPGASSQGFAGATGPSTASATGAGGGGGAGSVGIRGFLYSEYPGAQRTPGGNGGNGVQYSISGSAAYYGGGGGGGANNNSSATVEFGRGGSGGGGNGANNDRVNGTAGQANTGGGGGGGDWEASGANGGSGIVIVRYTTPAVPTNTAAPVISGTTRTGSTLSIVSDAWTGSPTSYAYQWKRATAASGSYSNISSATSSTYVLTDDDINKYIKVSVIATNGIGSSTAELSAASAVVSDLPDSVVPTATTPVSTANGFTFTISNYLNSYTYVLSTTKGSVSRSTDDVTVTDLTAGESATVTIAVSRTNYKPGSKTVTGSATPAVTTTTAAPALSIVIQAPVTTVAQGQASVATLAPTTTTLPVLGANGLPIPTTTTSLVKSQQVVATTLPQTVTTTTVGPPVVDKVDAGQTAVQVDGVKTDAVVTRDNNQMVVTAGSLSATMSGLDKSGKTSPLDSDGNIHLAAGDEIKISVGGFKPGSLVEVWLFSTPTQLGTAVVGADGTVSGTYRLPAGTKSGTHRVVVTARLANGKPTSFTLGILVGDISTTSTLTRVLIAIPITLAIGFGFILPTQLRRRRKIRAA